MDSLTFFRDFSNGLGVAQVTLWCLFLFRYLFDRNDFLDASRHKDAALTWTRAGTVMIGLVMVTLYNPENILRAEGMLSELDSFKFLTLAHILHCIGVSALLTAMDLASGGRGNSFPIYVAITFVPAFGLVWMGYE